MPGQGHMSGDTKEYNYDTGGYVTSYVECPNCGSHDTRALLGTAGGGSGGRYWCANCKRTFYWYWSQG